MELFLYYTTLATSFPTNDTPDCQKSSFVATIVLSTTVGPHGEMFCTVKIAVDNPKMNPSGSGGRRAFLFLDEGPPRKFRLLC